jgi:hypothetical protein
MARIRDYAVTVNATATASMVCEMPEHATGDLLVAFVNKDTASNFTTPSGWTAQQTQVSAGAGGGVYTKRAASGSETVTFALTSETCCAVVIAVQGCNGTTEADAVSGSAKSGADDSTLPFAGSGITPGHNNCLILHGLSTDGGIGANALPPWINLFAGDAAANSLCVCYTQQKTAAAITAPNHWALAADDTRGFIIAIRDDGTSGLFDAYLPLSTTPARQITALNGQGTSAVEKGTYTTAAGTTLTTLNGKSVSGVTIGTATADSGVNPFRSSANFTGVSSTTGLGHTEFVLTATDNLTELGGLVFGTWLHGLPRDYVDSGKAVQGGKYLVIGNDASNYRAWVIGGQFTKTDKADARNTFLIEVATSDTIYGSAGSPNYTTADFFAFGSAGYYGAVNIRFNELYLLGDFVLAGGSSLAPIEFNEMVFAVNNGGGILPLMQQVGSGALIWCPLKFGGVDPIAISCNLNTFQYPQKADEIDYVDFHVSNNKVGFEFDGQDRGGGDVDVLHFTNCVFTSPSSYYWRFASTHDAGADVDMTGSTVVGAAVTLRSGVSLAAMSFINCGTFTQNNAALASCQFADTKVTSDNPADISGCAFTSSGTGHGIEITAAGTYTFTGNTFTGYAGTNGSTGNEGIYNNSGGAVTINVVGGSTPTIRNGAGASTTVNNAVTIELTGLIAGSRIYIENTTDTVVLFNEIEATTTFSEAVNFTANKSLLIRVRHASGATKYKPFETTGTLTSTGYALVVNQVVDQ